MFIVIEQLRDKGRKVASRALPVDQRRIGESPEMVTEHRIFKMQLFFDLAS